MDFWDILTYAGDAVSAVLQTNLNREEAIEEQIRLHSLSDEDKKVLVNQFDIHYRRVRL